MRGSLLAGALAAALAVPGGAHAQTEPSPAYAPPPAAYPPSTTPPEQPPSTAQPARPPSTTPPSTQPPPSPPPASGSSQQVVVNPPAPSTAPPPQQPPATSAPSSSVTVNPPASAAPGTVYVDRAQGSGSTVVVDDRGRRDRPSPMRVVATNALYGGLAGVVVGAGIALINEGDDWGRDLMLGTGIGVLAGAIVGGVMAYRNESEAPVAMARDGLGTVALDRQRDTAKPTTGSLTFRW